MFHTESVNCILVVVVCGVTMASIEVVVHQTVANHDVVRVQGVVLLPQPQQRHLQSFIVILIILVGELTALILTDPTGFVVTVADCSSCRSVNKDSICPALGLDDGSQDCWAFCLYNLVK